LNPKQFPWNKAIIAFDTCALLPLYQKSKSDIDKFEEFLEKHSNRLFLPYHVIKEFVRHKDSKIFTDNETKGQSLKNLISQIREKLGQFGQMYYCETKLKQIRRKILIVSKKLDELEDIYNLASRKDNITGILDFHFHKKIGADLDQDDIANVVNKYDYRRHCNIPPGISDNNKSRNAPGDLFIWIELQKKAQDAKKDIILITNETNDKKQDWLFKKNGKFITMPGLDKEFYAFTKQHFYACCYEEVFGAAADTVAREDADATESEAP